MDALFVLIRSYRYACPVSEANYSQRNAGPRKRLQTSARLLRYDRRAIRHIRQRDPKSPHHFGAMKPPSYRAALRSRSGRKPYGVQEPPFLLEVFFNLLDVTTLALVVFAVNHIHAGSDEQHGNDDFGPLAILHEPNQIDGKPDERRTQENQSYGKSLLVHTLCFMVGQLQSLFPPVRRTGPELGRRFPGPGRVSSPVRR